MINRVLYPAAVESPLVPSLSSLPLNSNSGLSSTLLALSFTNTQQDPNFMTSQCLPSLSSLSAHKAMSAVPPSLSSLLGLGRSSQPTSASSSIISKALSSLSKPTTPSSNAIPSPLSSLSLALLPSLHAVQQRPLPLRSNVPSLASFFSPNLKFQDEKKKSAVSQLNATISSTASNSPLQSNQKLGMTSLMSPTEHLTIASSLSSLVATVEISSTLQTTEPSTFARFVAQMQKVKPSVASQVSYISSTLSYDYTQETAKALDRARKEPARSWEFESKYDLYTRPSDRKTIIMFSFDTPSPDDIVLAAQRGARRRPDTNKV